MHSTRRVSLVVMSLHACASVALAQPQVGAASADAERCAALSRLSLDSLRGAPTRVTSARLVAVPVPPPNAPPQSTAAVVEERSRPVYPYPTKVRYSGSGDPTKASSFVPVKR